MEQMIELQDVDPKLTLRRRIVDSAIIDAGIITYSICAIAYCSLCVLFSLGSWLLPLLLIPGFGTIALFFFVAGGPFSAPIIYRGICLKSGNSLTLGERWLGLRPVRSKLSFLDISCSEGVIAVLSVGCAVFIFELLEMTCFGCLRKAIGGNFRSAIETEIGVIPILFCLALAFGLNITRTAAFAECSVAERLQPIEIRTRSWKKSWFISMVPIGLFILSCAYAENSRLIIQSYWGKLSVLELLFWIFWLRPAIAYSRSPVVVVIYCLSLILPFFVFIAFGRGWYEQGLKIFFL